MKKSLWIGITTLLAAVAAVFLVVSQPVADQLPYVPVSNSELPALQQQGIKLIDIRRQDEWQQTGVVPGSILLTAFDGSGRLVPDFPTQLDHLVRKDEPFVLICRTGNRTNVLARALVGQAGYQKVYNVTDGITRWISGGGAVRKDCPGLSAGTQC